MLHRRGSDAPGPLPQTRPVTERVTRASSAQQAPVVVKGLDRAGRRPPCDTPGAGRPAQTGQPGDQNQSLRGICPNCATYSHNVHYRMSILDSAQIQVLGCKPSVVFPGPALVILAPDIQLIGIRSISVTSTICDQSPTLTGLAPWYANVVPRPGPGGRATRCGAAGALPGAVLSRGRP